MQRDLWKKIAILAGIVILGILLYGFLAVPRKTPIADEFNFHPDSVRKFSWSLQGRTFVYRRESRSKPWEPGVDSRNIQQKLNALGNLQLQKMTAPKEGLLIEVGFGPDNRWKGVYQDGRFVWTEGLRAGEGFTADSDVARIFEEGVFAFDPHQWSWCEKRPRVIGVKTDSIGYELFERDHAWFLKKDGKELKLEPTLVEKWLGVNCLASVDFFRDLKNFPLGLQMADGRLHLEFEGGLQRDYDWKAGFWLVDGERGIASGPLLKALEGLTSIPRP